MGQITYDGISTKPKKKRKNNLKGNQTPRYKEKDDKEDEDKEKDKEGHLSNK